MVFDLNRAFENDAYIRLAVPSQDSHQSEYIAPCDARRGNLLDSGLRLSVNVFKNSSVDFRAPPDAPLSHSIKRH